MNRLIGLDVVRAIAIIWVTLFHALVAKLHLPFAAVAKFGWMGVDLFFALSGYLIGSQLFKSYKNQLRPSLSQFYLRRSFRVLPAYLVIVGCYFMIPSFREEPGIQPFWQFITFTQNMFIDYAHHKAFSHAWSLCVEEHFYLIFPLLTIWLMKRPSLHKTVSFCLFLLMMGILLRGYIWLFELKTMEGFRPGRFGAQYFEKIYFPTYTRLDGLLVGVVVAGIRFFRPSWWSEGMKRGNSLLLLGVVGFAASIWLFQERQSFSASVFGYPLLSLSCGFVVAAGASTQSILGAFKIPFVSTISILSYSIYLTNKEAFHFMKLYFGDWVNEGGYQGLFFYSLAVFLAGAVLYGLVERPFLQWRDRICPPLI